MEHIKLEFNYNAALSRLKNIDWSSIKESVTEEEALLVKEYLIRASVFIADHDSCSRTPLFNPVEVAKSKVALPQEAESELESLLGEKVTPYMKLICKSYLLWSVLCSSDSTKYERYKGLFGPIIYYFQLGGSLTLGRNELKVGQYALPLSSWSKTEKSFEFDTETLEIIDQD